VEIDDGGEGVPQRAAAGGADGTNPMNSELAVRARGDGIV